MAGEKAKYLAVGATGAAAGVGGTSVFAFELFRQMQIDKLFVAANSTSTHIYAVTAFCMVACIILGTGYLAFPRPGLGPDEKDSQLEFFKLVTIAFMVVFVGGFVAMIFVRPSVNVRFVAESYKDQFLSFKDANDSSLLLVPYIQYPKKMISDDDKNGVRLVSDDDVIQIGVGNLKSLEDNYRIYEDEDALYRRDENILISLCNIPTLNASNACQEWHLPPRK